MGKIPFIKFDKRKKGKEGFKKTNWLDCLGEVSYELGYMSWFPLVYVTCFVLALSHSLISFALC